MSHTLSLVAAVVQKSRRRSRQRATAKPPYQGAPALCDAEDGMPKSPARVLGPYRNGAKWRLVVLDGSARKSLLAETEEQAVALRRELETAITAHRGRTVAEVADEYLTYKKDAGATENLLTFYRRAVAWLLPADRPIQAITPEQAEELYATFAKSPRRRDGEPIAVQTHHNALKGVKALFKWAVSRRYVSRNPFADVKPLGMPRRGKKQFRIDEARRFVEAAQPKALARDAAAAALLMEIYLGLRPMESLIRVVRDLDDEGRVLWIPFGKTDSSRRRLQVPEPLRQVLMVHAAGKSPEAPLLGQPGEGVHGLNYLHTHLHKLCEEAGVPKVCPHSLRGLSATLALEAGATGGQVAAALGHRSFAMTAKHYADPNTVANRTLRKVADVLGGSERPDLERLTALLHEHLTASELATLGQRLTAKSDGVG